MNWQIIHNVLVWIQHAIALTGIFIISLGVVFAFFRFLFFLSTGQISEDNSKVNEIRLNLGRILILGLEFIVAADLIGTTTAPDYYTVGLAAIIVAIRTLLSYSINREIQSLSKEE